METALTLPRARAVVLAFFVLLSLVIAAGPANAGTVTGDSTDYDIIFPVKGDHHFWDTFWASRSHGIHQAQDIMADKGVPVVAAASGTVRLVNWTSQSHMNRHRCCSLVIRHDDGWESAYIHLNNDSPGTDDGRAWGIAKGIVPGAPVSAGQVVGYVGDSGNAEATPSHLHFELYTPSGVSVNTFESLLAAGGNTDRPVGSDPLMAGSRLLRNGDRGLDVARLQELLEKLGQKPGPTDGIFGPNTEAAVRSYQQLAVLTVDGLVGVTTRGALAWDTAPADRILRRGARGHEVRTLQVRLAAAGFELGSPDGIFGPLTLVAVERFQARAGLVADGLVGARTRAALVS